MKARRQLGLLWGANSVILLVLSRFADAVVARVPACQFKSLAGLPCPGCGLTTSAYHLARLEPLLALEASPLATVFWIGLVAGGLVAGVMSLLGVEGPALPLRRLERSLAVRLVTVCLIVANWLYLIASR